jgi:hypothetical protein
MQHIVASGCSFTANYKPNTQHLNKTDEAWKLDTVENYTWFQWLWKIYKERKIDAKFHNYAAITNDNKTICRSIFYKVNDLVFNENVNPKDITVLIQWTALTRNSWFISNKNYNHHNSCLTQYIHTGNCLPHTNDFIQWKSKQNAYEHGYFYLSGGYYSPTNNPDNMQEFAIQYVNSVLSKEERYMEWFDSIIGLFSYLKELGVTKIKTFQLNNNFSSNYIDGVRTEPFYTNKDVYNNIINKKTIFNTWDSDIEIYKNPYVKMFADRIDFNKYFWFFEEENLHKYGGIIEWSIRNFNESLEDGGYNLPKVLWRELNNLTENQQMEYLNTYRYGHSSSILTKKFVEDIVLKWDIFE